MCRDDLPFDQVILFSVGRLMRGACGGRGEAMRLLDEMPERALWWTCWDWRTEMSLPPLLRQALIDAAKFVRTRDAEKFRQAVRDNLQRHTGRRRVRRESIQRLLMQAGGWRPAPLKLPCGCKRPGRRPKKGSLRSDSWFRP